MAAVRTVGVSPKVVIPTSALVGAAVVIAALDVFGVIDVDDALYLGLLGAAGVTGGAGYSAPPGKVQVTHTEDEERDLHDAEVEPEVP